MTAIHDRRITNRLLSYWVEVKGDRVLPTERDINIQELNDVWESCFLVQVRTQGAEHSYRYTYIGESVIEALGNDLTGQEIDATLLASNDIIHKFDKAVETATPIIDESEFVNLQGVTIKYRQSLLPFGNSREHISFILGGMKWKI